MTDICDVKMRKMYKNTGIKHLKDTVTVVQELEIVQCVAKRWYALWYTRV